MADGARIQARPSTPRSKKETRRTSRDDDWPSNYDVDDRLPFLLKCSEADSAPRRGSIKAQQVLGLVTVTKVKSGRGGRGGRQRGLVARARARSKSEERSSCGRVSALDISDDDDDGEGSSGDEELLELRSTRRHSLKAQQMLGLVGPRGMRMGGESGYRGSFLRRSESSEDRLLDSTSEEDGDEDEDEREHEDEEALLRPSTADTETSITEELGLFLELRTPEPQSVTSEAHLLPELRTPEPEGERPVSSSYIALEDWDRSLPYTPSPRALRSSGFVNFSRPLSQQSPQTAPAEFREQFRERPSTPQHRVRVSRDDIGLPRTPSRANTLALAKPIFEKVSVHCETPDMDKLGDHPYQHQRKRSSSLWTSLPMCLVRIGKRGSASSEPRSPIGNKKDKRKGEDKMALTEDNLRQYEVEVGHVPRPLNHALLPTPLHSPFQVQDPLFMDKGKEAEDKPLPTPPLSEEEDDNSGFAYTENYPPPATPSKIPQPSIEHPATPSKTPQTTHQQPATTPMTPPSTSTFRTPSVTPTLHIATAMNMNLHVSRTPTKTNLPICTVCREEKPASAFPIRQCTSTCTHAPHTCTSCIRTWISTCLESSGWDACACPECHEPLSYEDVKFFCAEEAFIRYDEITTRAFLSTIPSFHWCISPHCTSGQIHDPISLPLSTRPTFVCISCGHIYCLNHPSYPYHSGLSCPEFDALLSSPTHEEQLVLKKKQDQEKGDEALAKLIGKRCPNALCGWWIEKNEGCDHMTCWKCGWDWCWECGGSLRARGVGIGRRSRRVGEHRRGCRWFM